MAGRGPGRQFRKGQVMPAGRGRPKGSPARVPPQHIREMIAKGRVHDPLEVIAKMMVDQKLKPDLRFRAAAELASYIHPKLRSVELTGPNGQPLGPSASDLKDAMARALEEVAKARAALRANGTPGLVIEGRIEARGPEPLPAADTPAPTVQEVAVAVAVAEADDEDTFEPEP